MKVKLYQAVRLADEVQKGINVARTPYIVIFMCIACLRNTRTFSRHGLIPFFSFHMKLSLT